ncbi:MAG: hypothetical protein IJU07_04275 [Synergistaceae bacterium]|nr:hypothetical protein [Synergistaceae bacterium]
MYAALTIFRTGVVELLLKYGADVNAEDDEGKTALEYARGHEENAEILRKYGAKEEKGFFSSLFSLFD